MELTKNADKILRIVYKTYQSRKKSGMYYKNAVVFEYDFYNDCKDLSKIDESAFCFALGELNEVGYIRKYTDGGFMLMPAAIADMECRLENELQETIRYWIPIIISNAIAIAALIVSIVK